VKCRFVVNADFPSYVAAEQFARALLPQAELLIRENGGTHAAIKAEVKEHEDASFQIVFSQA
jgi:hypothetical protein